jgi:energy-coupling factor transporter ATP-binding protein EcfA2
MRTFEIKPATRDRVPLLIGLFGPSGSGKTFSALRLATGIQRVDGGKIVLVDSEAKRGLHYADRFAFQHLEFRAPFGSLDYLAAIEASAKAGASVVVVDSASHEHEGPGGMLDAHERELDRLVGDGPEWKREAMKFAAWAKPKADRQRLINTMLQIPVSYILCFRAKEKIKLLTKAEKEKSQREMQERGEKGRVDPVVPMGFMPIGDPAWVFEMTLSALLLPGADGVPAWDDLEPGSRQMIKLPAQFRSLFGESKQFSEDLGESMARWASGAPPKPPLDVDGMVARFNACTAESLQSLQDERGAAWGSLGKADKSRLKAAADAAAARITVTTAAAPQEN